MFSSDGERASLRAATNDKIEYQLISHDVSRKRGDAVSDRSHFAEQRERQKCHEEWLRAEIEKGLASAGTEPLIDHADALRQIHEAIAAAIYPR